MTDMNWDQKAEASADAHYPANSDKHLGAREGFTRGVSAALEPLQSGEAVERVARVLYKQSSPVLTFDQLLEDLKEMWRDKARAAIAALPVETGGEP